MSSRKEAGNAAVEMVMVAPVLLLLIATIVAAGRIISTRSALESVTREAARVASISSSSELANTAAKIRAEEVAEQLGLDSRRLSLDLQSGQFERGSPVTAAATYSVRISDLPAFGLLPGTFEVTAKQVEITERYGSR